MSRCLSPPRIPIFQLMIVCLSLHNIVTANGAHERPGASDEKTPILPVGAEGFTTKDTDLARLPLPQKAAPGGFAASRLADAIDGSSKSDTVSVPAASRVRIVDRAEGINAKGPDDFDKLNLEVARKEWKKIESRIRRSGKITWYKVSVTEGKARGKEGWLPVEMLSIKRIVVHLNRQVLTMYESDKEIATLDCVTGAAGKETEVGIYQVLDKKKEYTSKKYNSPMPYSLFFDTDGKAIHGTTAATLRSYLRVYVTQSVGSHGCVGLTVDDARKVFEWAGDHTRIEIVE